MDHSQAIENEEPIEFIENQGRKSKKKKKDSSDDTRLSKKV